MNNEYGEDGLEDMDREPSSDIVSVADAQYVCTDEVLPKLIDNEQEHDIEIRSYVGCIEIHGKRP